MENFNGRLRIISGKMVGRLKFQFSARTERLGLLLHVLIIAQLLMMIVRMRVLQEK